MTVLNPRLVSGIPGEHGFSGRMAFDSKGNIYVCGESESFLSGQTVGFVAKYAPLYKEPTATPIPPTSPPFNLLEYLGNQNWYMIGGFALFGLIIGSIIFGLRRSKSIVK
jgi:hypothetical protein